MNIQHRDDKNGGMFFITQDGKEVVEIVYAKGSDNTIIIEHTEVDEPLRKKNIGYELVHKTVDFARKQGLKVSPVCPFAKAAFDKTAEWQDLLA